MEKRTLMTQKLWNKCKKCGCDKPEDTEKLCEQCKAKRQQFWSDLKKVGGGRWRAAGGDCRREDKEEITREKSTSRWLFKHFATIYT